MPSRRIYLAKYRGAPNQRAHFAIFIPNASHDRSTVEQDFKRTPTLGTIIHVVGEPLMSGFTQELKRNYSATDSNDLQALVLLGSVDTSYIFDPQNVQYVKEYNARSRLEHEAMSVTPPPKGQNLRAPIDGVTTKRCQEWTMEYLQHLANRSLIRQEAIAIAQSQRDPPTFGIFGAARAVPQQMPNQQAAAARAAADPRSGEWIWDAEHKRYRRWDGAKWVWQ